MRDAVQVVASGSEAVVVKLRGDVRALEAEAVRLRSAAHPGVVSILGWRTCEGGAELRTRWAGRTLASAGQLDITHAATIVAAVAETLSDLHELGIVHGHVDAEHILLGIEGRPLLCGFGLDDAGLTPADDVAAIGRVLAAQLAGPPEPEAIPARRFVRIRRDPTATIRRALLTLADHATAEVATRRPTARRLAAAIVTTLGPRPRRASSSQARASGGCPDRSSSTSTTKAVDQPDEADTPAQHLAPRARPTLPAVGLVLAAAVVLLCALAAWPRLASPDDRPATDPTAPLGAAAPDLSAQDSEVSSPPPGPDTVQVSPVQVSAAPVVPLDRGCATPGSGPDVDGDGCADAVQVEGSVVRVDERRWQVGAPGDVVVVGDWDCDGAATPAALRPSSGDVFIFDAWPTGGEVVASAAETVLGAVDLVAGGAIGTGSCDELTAVLGDGRRIALSSEGPG